MVLQTVLNGKPTGQQVEALVNKIKLCTDNDVIPHEEIESAIGEKRGSPRYYQIVGRANRRCEREFGVVLGAEKGVGYRRATGPQQMRISTRKMRTSVKGIRRSGEIMAAISDDRLPDPKLRAARDHVVGQIRYLFELAKTKRKEIELTIGKPDTNPQMLPV